MMNKVTIFESNWKTAISLILNKLGIDYGDDCGMDSIVVMTNVQTELDKIRTLKFDTTEDQ